MVTRPWPERRRFCTRDSPEASVGGTMGEREREATCADERTRYNFTNTRPLGDSFRAWTLEDI